MIRLREAAAPDAAGMAAVQTAIAAARGTQPGPTPEEIHARYIDHPDRIACTVAQAEDGRVLGFQSLRRARAGNPYDTPEGWGIIGTHVAPDAAGRGVGRALWRASETAARAAGIALIDAAIGAGNAAGLAYYAAMGFCTRREGAQTVSKLKLVGDGVPPPPQARIARPAADLQALLPFYCDGLGFDLVGHFTAHDGFDGIMLALPGSDWHLEFTHRHGHPAPPPPDPEVLMVLYLPEPTAWAAAVGRLEQAGFRRLEAANPYWTEWGATFADPEGNRTVIARLHWG